MTVISRRISSASADYNSPRRSFLIIVKAIRTTSRVTPSGAFLSQFRRGCRRVASRRHPKTLVRGPFEIRVACGKIRSPHLSSSPRLALYAFVQSRQDSLALFALATRRSLAEAIPGIHQEPQFQVLSSRRDAPSAVSLPVGRHYLGASRKFIVHGYMK